MAMEKAEEKLPVEANENPFPFSIVLAASLARIAKAGDTRRKHVFAADGYIDVGSLFPSQFVSLCTA